VTSAASAADAADPSSTASSSNLTRPGPSAAWRPGRRQGGRRRVLELLRRTDDGSRSGTGPLGWGGGVNLEENETGLVAK
jgi:hypothetical protein